MGKIVVTTNISLDGVAQDPTGEEGFRLGGWFYQFGGKDLEQWAKVETEEATGRRGHAAGAQERRVVRYAVAGSDGRMGGQVEQPAQVRRVLHAEGAQVVQRDRAQRRRGQGVSKLKREIDGEILVYASYQLVHTLIEHDLVDEFRLVVFPVVLGAGKRLFGETSDKTPLRLVGTQTIGEGLALLTYEVVRAA